MSALTPVGNDGVATLGTGSLNVKVWAATVSRVSTDTTGFSASGKTRRLGVVDITGSLAGQPIVGNGATSTPWGTITANALPDQPGGTLTLSVYGSGTATTVTNAAFLQFDALYSSMAFNVDKNGDSTLSLNFEMNDSSGPVIVWATSL